MDSIPALGGDGDRERPRFRPRGDGIDIVNPFAVAARIAERRRGDEFIAARPPVGMARVLALRAEEGIELSELAAAVPTDPALAADLLRAVNSAYFRLDREVGSISRAVTNAMTVRNVYSEEFAIDFLRRAVTAARKVESLPAVDPDDAFAAGRSQDIGMLLLAALNRAVSCAQWNSVCSAPPDARRTLERALFNDAHDEFLAALAEVWNLPATMDALHLASARAPRSCARLLQIDYTFRAFAGWADATHRQVYSDRRARAVVRIDGRQTAPARLRERPLIES